MEATIRADLELAVRTARERLADPAGPAAAPEAPDSYEQLGLFG